MSWSDARLRSILLAYAERVRDIRSDSHHSPETSLYAPFESLLSEILDELEWEHARIIQQYRTQHLGAPDFGVRTPAGTSYIEAKEPNTNLAGLRGRDREQFERYMRLGNIAYTNFTEIRLFQKGEELAGPAEIVPEAWLDPRGPQPEAAALHPADLCDLLQRFLSFARPSIRNVSDLAEELARAAWLLRDAVHEATEKDEGGRESPLEEIYHEFRDVLFHELTRTEFADAYAQTLAYGLLLARQETDDTLTTDNVAGFLDPRRHRLLSATLRLLSMPEVVRLIGWTIDNLVSVVNQVSTDLLRRAPGQPDPLLYFYEDFLTEYDPALRRQRGVYYTPPEVVNLQTRAVEHVLRSDFERPYGFADEGVQTLDPAVGTGTYLLSALDLACERVRTAVGEGSVADAASAVADRLYGFEILVGPYTVAHFRLWASVRERSPGYAGRIPIVLTDTLLPAEGQAGVEPRFGFMSAPLNAERELADDVKQRRQIMVVLGNPPYRRAKAESGWVWDTLLESFREPVRGQYSADLKNLADLYVWFYRWALWKLFESESAPDSCILTFISNSKWILGGAFGGMREMMRSRFDRIYVIDLHGDNRAPLPADVEVDENVFDIQVGVSISLCIADGSRQGESAKVFYYGDTWGTRNEKMEWLNQVEADLSNVAFEEAAGDGTDPFFPRLGETFRSWPVIRDQVFNFSISGIQTKRDHLVVAPTTESLRTQIQDFLGASSSRQSDLFHETRDKKSGEAARTEYSGSWITPYSYRTLDQQFLYNHPAFVEYPRTRSLRAAWGKENLAMATMRVEHGSGPAVSVHRFPPDLNVFGARSSYVFPLWDSRGENSSQESVLVSRQHNFNPALVNSLSRRWDLDFQEDFVESLFFYVFGILNAPSYTLEFARELARSSPRVPFPTDRNIFERCANLGRQLVELHTFEERYPGDGSIQIHGSASRLRSADYEPETARILIDESAAVGPVTEEGWAYAVSGYDVIRQWILRRTGVPFDFAVRRQLIDVIWAVERTVEIGSDLDDLLSQVVEGGTLSHEELGIQPSKNGG